MATNDELPALAYAPATCPVCGARTVEQASRMCRSASDETGEHYCQAGMDEDAEGNLTLMTPESYAAFEAGIARLMAEQPL